MTLSVKALTQNKRRTPAEQRCATSATIYNAAGQPMGQKGAFKMWRRSPHRIHTHLTKPVIHTHLSDKLTLVQQGSLEILTLETEVVKTSEYHKVVARDSLGCDADCWNRSQNSKNCYLNGSTQEYIKDTCPNSKTLQKCGLPVATTGTAGRRLNIGTARNSGLVLPRTARAFILQPKCPLKSGLTLRGPNSVQTTQQLLQLQGIDYARGGRCNVPGRVVPIIGEQPKTLSEMTTEDQELALDTKVKPPAFRLGAMPNTTYANHQRVMARRNGCADPGSRF